MASNKNQHFVPKAYLRPFASDGDGAINIHVIDRDLSRRNVSIKDQCSRHYFYGTAQPVEDFIQFFEGRYGALIPRLRRGDFKPKDVSTLFRFFVLQHLRTPHQLDRRAEVAEAYRNTVIGGRPLYEVSEEAREPFDPQREMQQQLYIAAKTNDYLHDLEPVLLLNLTSTPFVTSDNPACIMNRLHDQRYRDETSGLIQSGISVVLPLTEKIAFFAYDREVYRDFRNGGIAFEVRNARDIDRLNELQAQIASNALYFSNWADRDYVKQLANRCKPKRREQWAFIWTAIKFDEDEDHELYRAVTPEDAESTAPRVTSVSMIVPAPTTWPSFLRFKMRPMGFSNGSAIGYVRPGYALRNERNGWQAVNLPLQVPAHHTPAGRRVLFMRKKARRT